MDGAKISWLLNISCKCCEATRMYVSPARHAGMYEGTPVSPSIEFSSVFRLLQAAYKLRANSRQALSIPTVRQ